MLVGYLTLLSGLLISAIAIYYSVEGLVAIYPAMVIPIVIMGVVIELGKLSLTVWLKQNWERAPVFLKAYMMPAVAVLMLITSIGVFGFLSKAHSDQSLVSGDVQSRISIYDEKIKTAKENIESDRKQLKQMDEAVDQVMARSQDEKGADKSNSIRKSQQRDRIALSKDIEANQKIISQLNDEAAPIRAEVRKVEADVGPIKYIAALVYGSSPDANMLERAVTWITILIVIVLDPLAVVLLLASQYSFAWAKEQENTNWIDSQADELNDSKFVEEPWEVHPDEGTADEILKAGVTNSNPADNVPVEIKQAFEGVKDPTTGEWIQTGPSFTYTTVTPSEEATPEEDEALNTLTKEQEKSYYIGLKNDPPVIDYKVLDEDSEADWPEPPTNTTFTHEQDKIIVHDDAGTMVIPLKPELPVAEIINAPGYIVVEGQMYHEGAAPPHIKPNEKTYVQNEEQAESNKWMNVVAKTQTVSEEEYLNTLEQKKQENNGK
jgi:hypothetical protein